MTAIQSPSKGGLFARWGLGFLVLFFLLVADFGEHATDPFEVVIDTLRADDAKNFVVNRPKFYHEVNTLRDDATKRKLKFFDLRYEGFSGFTEYKFIVYDDSDQIIEYNYGYRTLWGVDVPSEYSFINYEDCRVRAWRFESHFFLASASCG